MVLLSRPRTGRSSLGICASSPVSQMMCRWPMSVFERISILLWAQSFNNLQDMSGAGFCLCRHECMATWQLYACQTWYSPMFMAGLHGPVIMPPCCHLGLCCLLQQLQCITQMLQESNGMLIIWEKERDTKRWWWGCWGDNHRPSKALLLRQCVKTLYTSQALTSCTMMSCVTCEVGWGEGDWYLPEDMVTNSWVAWLHQWCTCHVQRSLPGVMLQW